MKITIQDFKEGETIPKEFTCDGTNHAPGLYLEDVPKNAKSLGLIMDDPDAPNGTWTHWTAWNLNPAVLEIRQDKLVGTVEGGLGSAIEGVTSRGKPGYHGPCPPSGVHRYYFRVYALNTILDLKGDADVAKLRAAMEGHVIAETEYMGTYTR
jgi:hypothetical protein